MSPSSPGLLRAYPPFARFWVALTLSSIGTGMATTALVLYVQQTQGTGIAVAVLLTATTIPRLLGPLAGSIVDRFDLRSLLAGCDIDQAAIFAALAASYAFVLLAMRDQPIAVLLRRALLGALLRPLPTLAALAVVALLWLLHILFYPASIFMPAVLNFSFGMLAVSFGVHQATVRLLALQGAEEGPTYAGGSAQSARNKGKEPS